VSSSVLVVGGCASSSRNSTLFGWSDTRRSCNGSGGGAAFPRVCLFVWPAGGIPTSTKSLLFGGRQIGLMGLLMSLHLRIHAVLLGVPGGGPIGVEEAGNRGGLLEGTG